MDDAADEEARLETDMARLGRRPYAEVGVPMFLLAEDLRRPAPPPGAAAGTAELTATFVALAEALTRRRADVSHAEVARLIEVLADRHILGGDAPDFTRLSEAGTNP